MIGLGASHFHIGIYVLGNSQVLRFVFGHSNWQIARGKRKLGRHLI
jgi:hypothetical protein